MTTRSIGAAAARWCLVLHRYLGLTLSVLFLVWFLSGFVMMYKSFPVLTPGEKRALAKPLLPGAVRLSPEDARLRSGIGELSSVHLGMAGDRPLYRFRAASGEWRAIYADAGERLRVDEALARAVAEVGRPVANSIQSVGRIDDCDQWSPTTGYAPHLPMYRVRFDDSDLTTVYVSSATGEVVQKLGARDKLWAWLGPIPHWLYFRSLRVRQGFWEWTVIVLSGLGIFTCAAGLVLGWVRFERRPDSIAFSPYEQRWFRWHHYAGFFFGIFVLTWTLSGLLSMNPFDWSPSRALSPPEARRWRGGDLDLARFRVHPRDALESLASVGTIQEMELVQVRGRDYYLAYYEGNETRLFAADGSSSAPLAELPDEELLAALTELTDAPITERRLLTEYDDYYYATKNEERPLPVLRIQLADAARRWYYVSPQIGAVIDRLETRSRVNRWLYQGLHSLDFAFLRNRRPAWDLLVGVLMAGGTAVCGTGVVLSFRWLRSHRRFRSRWWPR